jgi:sulfate permease, SulP family
MRSTLSRLPLVAIYRREFAGYSLATFRRDLLAGLTVGAVALPLALAFGVASGATAAAGMVTAILAGVVIAALGGAPFQISGPTGAMSAVLIVLAQRYGLGGIWVACLLAGVLLILLGAFRLGRYITFIPSPVITGFTSGIALIIAIGQLDNVLGVTNPHAADNALEKLLHYFREPPAIDWHTLVIAALVAATMLVLPRLTKAVPGSLAGLALASIVVLVAGWPVPVIGTIPQTLLLEDRLTWQAIPWGSLNDLLPAAFSIAALGAIESLLCGAVGANMTGRPMDANQELIGQGIGNLIIPFFGGVPATAAIARTSVGIKSGGVTRMVSFVHAALLLLSVFALGPLIGRIPLSALGGVLLVTAWRMNEWESIRFFGRARLKHALAGMLVTMVATVALDLTQAILIGIAISALIYLRQSASSTEVQREPVDIARLRGQGHMLQAPCPGVHVYYLTGPLFFGSVHAVLEAFETAHEYRTLVISMRGVPLIDVMGAQALTQIAEEQHARGGAVYFSGIQPAVREMFNRTGLGALVGANHIFWSADQAIIAVHHEHAATGCTFCAAHPAAVPAVPATEVAEAMDR